MLKSTPYINCTIKLKGIVIEPSVCVCVCITLFCNREPWCLADSGISVRNQLPIWQENHESKPEYNRIVLPKLITLFELQDCVLYGYMVHLPCTYIIGLKF